MPGALARLPPYNPDATATPDLVELLDGDDGDDGVPSPPPHLPLVPGVSAVSAYHDAQELADGEYGNFACLDVLDEVEVSGGDEILLVALGLRFPVTGGRARIKPPFIVSAAMWARPTVRVYRNGEVAPGVQVRMRGRNLKSPVHTALREKRYDAFRVLTDDGREVRYLNGMCGIHETTQV